MTWFKMNNSKKIDVWFPNFFNFYLTNRPYYLFKYIIIILLHRVRNSNSLVGDRCIFQHRHRLIGRGWRKQSKRHSSLQNRVSLFYWQYSWSLSMCYRYWLFQRIRWCLLWCSIMQDQRLLFAQLGLCKFFRSHAPSISKTCSYCWGISYLLLELRLQSYLSMSLLQIQIHHYLLG